MNNIITFSRRTNKLFVTFATTVATPNFSKYIISHWSPTIHRMTVASFAITLRGHCCRRHAVDQQVVSDISVVRS